MGDTPRLKGAWCAKVLTLFPDSFPGVLGASLTGKALQAMRCLAEAGWRRQDLFITSCVKCRPPDNRTPRAGELSTCREAWLEPQIQALQPDLLVLMGGVAVRSVLGRREPLEILGAVGNISIQILNVE